MSDIPIYDRPIPEVADHPLFSGQQSVGMMSAEKPRFPVAMQGEAPALRHMLTQHGLKWEETQGDYDGPEHSFIIHGPSRDQMYHLGKALGQESVVFSQGGQHELLYTNGPDDQHFHPSHPQYGFHPTEAPPSYWTKLPGRGYLRLHFNFDAKHRAPLALTRAEIAQELLERLEPLAKRSKNVREQVRNITPQQAIMRRIRYAQGLGLRPKNTPESEFAGQFPKASRNQLEYNPSFPVEHETAHAMMTPPDSTIRQYQTHLTAASKMPDTDNPERWERAAGPHEGAVYDENVASAVENQIDRRAGVDPSKFRNVFRAPVAPLTTESTEGFGTGEPRRAPHTSPRNPDNYVEPFDPEIQEAARDVARPFDEGARFTPQGRVQQPQGVDQKINQGQAGVNWLRQTRQKLGAK